MATHSSILAWQIPWTEEPGGLQSMDSYTQPNLAQSDHKDRGRRVLHAVGIVSLSSAGLEQESI